MVGNSSSLTNRKILRAGLTSSPAKNLLSRRISHDGNVINFKYKISVSYRQGLPNSHDVENNSQWEQNK